VNIRQTLLPITLFLLVCAAGAQDKLTNKTPTNPGLESGKRTYIQYCAPCHGNDGRGNGPAASALKTPPADLTTLAKRNEGKFPYEYVTGVIRFGKPIVAHGSSDMPVWGPIFGVLENGNEMAVRKRIKDVCDYLAAIQEKES
jgi:mono/diheme cytochrome c family protein